MIDYFIDLSHPHETSGDMIFSGHTRYLMVGLCVMSSARQQEELEGHRALLRLRAALLLRRHLLFLPRALARAA